MKSGKERKAGKAASSSRKKSAGRPNCLNQEKLVRLLEAYYSHPYSLRELAGMFGVSRMTVWRAVQEMPMVGVRV